MDACCYHGHNQEQTAKLREIPSPVNQSAHQDNQCYHNVQQYQTVLCCKAIVIQLISVKSVNICFSVDNRELRILLDFSSVKKHIGDRDRHKDRKADNSEACSGVELHTGNRLRDTDGIRV